VKYKWWEDLDFGVDEALESRFSLKKKKGKHAKNNISSKKLPARNKHKTR
jgi:hypothetical protein